MIVSNSNIATFQKCERMFYYGVVLNLQTKHLPPFLKRGTFGHTCMETGFEVIMNGGTIEDASQVIAEGPLKDLMESGDPDTPEMMKVYRHVITFISWSQQENTAWRPVALEDRGMWCYNQQQDIPKDSITSEDLVFGYTPDLIIEFTQGAYKGQHAVLDYKFLGQYMNEIEVEMAQQIPKYIIYRNKTKTDFKIRRGAFVQLNTRATPDATGHKLFIVKWVEPNKHRLQRIEYENERLVARVAAARDIYTPDDFLRTVNQSVCGRCFFQEICTAELNGKSESTVHKIIERGFIQNDYGY